MRYASIFLISLFIISNFMIFKDVSADNVSDLQRQIEERNRNIAELQKEIAAYKQEVDKTSAKAKSLQNTINILTTTGKKLDADIKVTKNKIEATNLTIEKISNEIQDKEERARNLSQSTEEALRTIYKTQDTSFIQTFLESKSLTEGLIVYDEFDNIIKTIQEKIDELQGIKRDLEGNKIQTEEEKTNLETFWDTLSDQQKVITLNKNQQASLLTATKNEEAGYQKLLAEKEAKKAAFEKELYEYEARLKYTLDPSSIPQSGSAPFSWPLQNVYMTQLFGKTSASGRLYASGTHNGVDFRALMGTPVQALADGVVMGAGDTDIACAGASFGRWVLIKYDNGLSAIFAHLSVIKVTEGQRVARGQTVALSGNTGYSTGPHLHVSVYPANAVTVQDRPSLSCGGKVYHMPIAAVNAYLDPMLYFPKL